MEFKIDTRSNHVLIRPLSEVLSANVAESLQQQCSSLSEDGGQNYIIDLSDCQSVSTDALDALAALHEMCYSSEQSLVFTGISVGLMAALKEGELNDVLNTAPTEQEAIDIVSMEILERDLFSEGE